MIPLYQKYKKNKVKSLDFADRCNENPKNPNYELDDINLPEQSYNIIFCNGDIVKRDAELEGIKLQRYDDLISSSTSPEKFLRLSKHIFTA